MRRLLVIVLVGWLAGGCDPRAPKPSQPAPASNGVTPPAAAFVFPTNVTAHPPPLADYLDPDLALPQAFIDTLRHRLEIDHYQSFAYATVEAPPTAPRPQVHQRDSKSAFVHVHYSRTPGDLLTDRLAIVEKTQPMRGFRFLDSGAEIANTWPIHVAADLKSAQRDAADHIRRRLAADGLLPVLIQAVSMLQPERLAGLAAPEAALELRALGFPVDWLDHFRARNLPPDAPRDWIRRVAGQLAAGQSAEAVTAEASRRARFDFSASREGFETAAECGDEPIGLVRMQLGGGYQDGIVPGGTLDMMGALVAALPEADFVISTPQSMTQNIRNLARNYWALQRPNQVTLIAEGVGMTAWAQDNGKAGLILEDGAPSQWATLLPRFASQGEGNSLFMPGDSFLAEGLASLGHGVVFSPLLFQGGNTMVIDAPGADRRTLFLGESELYRNTAMGLTRIQVEEAFRIEFAADECLILPVASFHIDFDLTVRHHAGRALIFVNDPIPAAQLVVTQAMTALIRQGALEAGAAAQWQRLASENRWDLLAAAMSGWIDGRRDGTGRCRADLLTWFAGPECDDAQANLRLCLLSLDLLASAAEVGDGLEAVDELRGRYHDALRHVLRGNREQRLLLESRGFDLVPVPSFPDLANGMNYLNALHDRDRVLMPAHTGFYANLDEAAMAAYRRALGPAVEVIPIPSVGALQQYGAVHCAASAYPDFPQATLIKSGTSPGP